MINPHVEVELPEQNHSLTDPNKSPIRQRDHRQ